MKRNIFIIAVMTCMLFAGEITWKQTYSQGVEAAQKNHKPMLLFIYKPGCGACEFMEENVFTDKLVYFFINREFIPVKLNINKNDAPENLQSFATPTFQFVDDHGKKLRETLIGGKTGKAFVDVLKEAVENYKK